MSRRKFLILWHIYAFIYLCIFIAFFAVVPEVTLFDYLSIKYGFIDIERWDIYYSIFAMSTTVIINFLFILLTFRFISKTKKG